MPWLEKTPVPSTFEEDREGSIHSSTLGDSSGSGDEEAREIKEVENAAQADTAIINRWRFVLAVVLLGTAAAVTGLAFSFLDAEQQDNFDAAYKEFALTVEDAVLRQQTDIRDSLRGFSEQLSSAAHALNTTWPFFTMPDFEVHAEQVLKQSQTEFLGVFHVVNHTDRLKFEEYADYMHRDWIQEGHRYRYGDLSNLDEVAYHPYITRAGSGFGTFDAEDELDQYTVSWTYSPPPVTYGATNHNQRGPLIDAVLQLKNETLMGPVESFKLGDIIFSTQAHDAFHSRIKGSSSDFPHGQYLHPVHREVANSASDVVAYLEIIVGFDVSMRNLLPDTVKGLVAVLSNTCEQTYTYGISGKDALFLGDSDLHDTKFDSYRREMDLSSLEDPVAVNTPGHCIYKMEIYPSQTFKDQYYENTPLVMTVGIALAFVVVMLVFVVYDIFVKRRNSNLVLSSARNNALITSMFPRHIRDQMLQQKAKERSKKQARRSLTKSDKMKGFLNGSDQLENEDKSSKPLAELYLETTVAFCDIAGFTAWSSTREPSQVFELLEQSFVGMDHLARKIGIFKVETVGDCYVAVAGLPEPRHDHAFAMARFASAALNFFDRTMKKMEVKLGPDTSELQLRIGIHSGPVTAGVLRGDKARFQLFGDTMNTTSRIESTGMGGKIHVSTATATILQNKGMGSWLVEREYQVEAKGKGLLLTYWLVTPKDKSEDKRAESAITDLDSSKASSEQRNDDILDDKTQRLVQWNTDALLQLLRQVVARRKAREQLLQGRTIGNACQVHGDKTRFPIDEVKEIIHLPSFDKEVAKVELDPASIRLSKNVAYQLHAYVEQISQMYGPNAFHSFEHCSHVLSSVTKLLSRIVAPATLEEEMAKRGNHAGSTAAASLHDHTYGITSEPLTQFACAFSALIHDVDHLGVPNTQLVEEKTPTALRYNNRSVAEQNSLDISWNLLMQDDFKDLRNAIFSNEEEKRLFRSLVVNAVMATDIADKDLKNLRNQKWQKAFTKASLRDDDKSSTTEESEEVSQNRKATIVIEHLIQASDISHTMQHWQVYRKWNERLFCEMYAAYKEGRSNTNPASFWAKGEIGFFDFYIIPLAKKLKECGVFGISSGEFLSYAMSNRHEWEQKGADIVEGYIQKLEGSSKPEYSM